MVDKGQVVNLMDDYSPYLLDEITYLVDGVKRGNVFIPTDVQIVVLNKIIQ